jgi:hypothetical protein
MVYYKNKNKNKKNNTNITKQNIINNNTYQKKYPNHQKYKLYTKKSGGSEVLNSTLTKKSLPLQKYNISKGGYIKEVNKNIKNIQSKAHKNVKKCVKYVKPDTNSLETILKGGKFDLDQALNVASRDTFAITTALEYKALRFKIKVQKFKSRNNKFTVGLLDVHKYLARINLDYMKLLKVMTDLIGEGESKEEENKKVAKIHEMINDIVELEKLLHTSGEYVPVTLSGTNAQEVLKRMAKKYIGYGSGSKWMRVFSDKYDRLTHDFIIYYVIKMQDRIREEIKKISLFDNTGDLSTGCSKVKQILYGTRNKLLCPLGKFRKREAKFNKHFMKFKMYFEKFTSLVKCNESIRKNINLNIYDDDINATPTNIMAMFDQAECNIEKEKGNFNTQVNNINKNAKQLFSTFENTKFAKKLMKDKEKMKEYEKKMKEGVKSFEKIIKEVETTIKFIKQNMRNLESAYCIRLYRYNLPAKKGFWQSIKGTTRKNIFVKQQYIDRLVKEPMFIDNFEKLIRGLDAESKSLTTPESKDEVEKALKSVLKPDDKQFIDDKGERLKVIPNVLLYEKINGNDFKKKDLNVININFVETDKSTEFNSINENVANNTHIICAQNCSSTMLKTQKIKYNDGGNDIEFIPVAFSGYSKNEKGENTKFNVIFIRKDIIQSRSYEKEGGIDQTDYFQLDIAKGMDPKYSRSFASVNIFFMDEDDTPEKKLTPDVITTFKAENNTENNADKNQEINKETDFTKKITTLANANSYKSPEKRKEKIKKVFQSITINDISDDNKENIKTLVGLEPSIINAIVTAFNKDITKWNENNGKAMKAILETDGIDKDAQVGAIITAFNAKFSFDTMEIKQIEAMVEIMKTANITDPTKKLLNNEIKTKTDEIKNKYETEYNDKVNKIEENITTLKKKDASNKNGINDEMETIKDESIADLTAKLNNDNKYDNVVNFGNDVVIDNLLEFAENVKAYEVLLKQKSIDAIVEEFIGAKFDGFNTYLTDNFKIDAVKIVLDNYKSDYKKFIDFLKTEQEKTQKTQFYNTNTKNIDDLINFYDNQFRQLYDIDNAIKAIAKPTDFDTIYDYFKLCLEFISIINDHIGQDLQGDGFNYFGWFVDTLINLQQPQQPQQQQQDQLQQQHQQQQQQYQQQQQQYQQQQQQIQTLLQKIPAEQQQHAQQYVQVQQQQAQQEAQAQGQQLTTIQQGIIYYKILINKNNTIIDNLNRHQNPAAATAPPEPAPPATAGATAGPGPVQQENVIDSDYTVAFLAKLLAIFYNQSITNLQTHIKTYKYTTKLSIDDLNKILKYISDILKGDFSDIKLNNPNILFSEKNSDLQKKIDEIVKSGELNDVPVPATKKKYINLFFQIFNPTNKIYKVTRSFGQGDKFYNFNSVTSNFVPAPTTAGGARPDNFPHNCLRIVSTELISLNNNAGANEKFDIEMIKSANTYKNENNEEKTLRTAQFDKIKELVKKYTGDEPDIIAGDFGGFFYKMGEDQKEINFAELNDVYEGLYSLVLLYIYIRIKKEGILIDDDEMKNKLLNIPYIKKTFIKFKKQYNEYIKAENQKLSWKATTSFKRNELDSIDLKDDIILNIDNKNYNDKIKINLFLYIHNEITITKKTQFDSSINELLSKLKANYIEAYKTIFPTNPITCIADTDPCNIIYIANSENATDELKTKMTEENKNNLKVKAVMYGLFCNIVGNYTNDINSQKYDNDIKKNIFGDAREFKDYKTEDWWKNLGTKTNQYYNILTGDKSKYGEENFKQNHTLMIPIKYILSKYDIIRTSGITINNLWDKIKEHFENINKLNNEKQNEELNTHYSEYLKSKLKDPSPDNLHYLLEFLSIGNKFVEYKTRYLYDISPPAVPVLAVGGAGGLPAAAADAKAAAELKTRFKRVIEQMKSKPLTTAVLMKSPDETISKIKIPPDTTNTYVFSALFTPTTITLKKYNDEEQPIYRRSFEQKPSKSFNYEPKGLNLYTKLNLQALMLLLDKYQSVFTLGHKPYLKRDLGCFSLLDEEFGARKLDNLTTLYTLNNPGFIEAYLNKYSGFFNTTHGQNDTVYYSENQILRGDSSVPVAQNFDVSTTLFYNINNNSGTNPIYSKVFQTSSIDNKKQQQQCVRDVMMRMLLIPSKDLVELTGVKNIRNTEKPSKSKNSNTKISNSNKSPESGNTISDVGTQTYYNPIHYVQLAQTFTLKFYRDKALPKLLHRLNQIVNYQYDKPDVSGKDKRTANPEKFIEILLKRNQQGNYINLGNRALVANFYEFIFIMLKIKYIDHQIASLSSLQPEDVIMAGIRAATISTPAKTFGGSLQNSRRFLTFNSSQKHITPKQHFKSKNQNGSQLRLKTKKKNRKTKTNKDTQNKQEYNSQINSQSKNIKHKRTKHALKL